MKNLSFWITATVLIGGVVAVASGIGDEGRMRELDGAVAWVNSAPLSSKALRGKVVVNVAYPIPIDSNHSIWTNFRNEYWPADYFIDGKGRIRYHHFGEGEYEKSERVIKTLPTENGATGLDESIVHIKAEGPEAPPGNDVQSPETYIGYARAESFASPERMARESRRIYSPPARPRLNQWGLGGSWSVGAERATLESAPGTIVFRFHSRDLHMVLGPSKNGTPVRFKVKVNGAASGDDPGSDSAADGTGEVRQPRMYQLAGRRG